ncbi:MAG: hypothetical protein LBJ39_01790 [Tannerellaceae bacterium]|nr:hypothetical protein [Tannerellaceae bacterium]
MKKQSSVLYAVMILTLSAGTVAQAGGKDTWRFVYAASDRPCRTPR